MLALPRRSSHHSPSFFAAGSVIDACRSVASWNLPLRTRSNACCTFARSGGRSASAGRSFGGEDLSRLRSALALFLDSFLSALFFESFLSALFLESFLLESFLLESFLASPLFCAASCADFCDW